MNPATATKTNGRTSAKTARVADYMSGAPICIADDAPVAWAHDLMRKHRVRHLPVLRGENVVGMLTLADLHLFETHDDRLLDDAVVADAMQLPLLVEPSDDIAGIAMVMANDKIEAAVVIEKGAAIGVFTTTDALRALSRG